MTSPKNEHAHITRFQLRSLDELAQRPKHLQPPLMQGIINAAEITVSLSLACSRRILPIMSMVITPHTPLLKNSAE